MTSVSVVGLGAMGRPIARNLLGAGFDVTVWNRSPEAVAELVEEGGEWARKPLPRHSSPVLCCRCWQMIRPCLRPFWIPPSSHPFRVEPCTSTWPPSASTLPSAPPHCTPSTVSGTSRRRCSDAFLLLRLVRLNIIAAGDSSLLERVQPFLDVIGARTWPQGERPEQANIVKIIGNYLILAAIQSLGEAITLGERSGVGRKPTRRNC